MVRISFIVPAFNESLEITACLRSVFAAAREVGVPFDVTVVNDASIDNTADLARQAGARVIEVQCRQIAKVRNAGARQASGELLIFVDADTRISAPVLRSALAAFEAGAVGGGAFVRMAGPVSAFAHAAMAFFGLIYSRLLNWAAGCFVFARKTDFMAVGGFDESLFAGEEIALSRALKKRGRFVVVHEAVWTSSRKLRLYGVRDFARLFGQALRRGPAVVRGRDALGVWYDGRRES